MITIKTDNLDSLEVLTLTGAEGELSMLETALRQALANDSGHGFDSQSVNLLKNDQQIGMRIMHVHVLSAKEKEAAKTEKQLRCRNVSIREACADCSHANDHVPSYCCNALTYCKQIDCQSVEVTK